MRAQPRQQRAGGLRHALHRRHCDRATGGETSPSDCRDVSLGTATPLSPLNASTVIFTDNLADLSTSTFGQPGTFFVINVFDPNSIARLSIGTTLLFAFDNGIDSVIYRCVEAVGDGFVTSNELTQVACFTGTVQLATTDFVFV